MRAEIRLEEEGKYRMWTSMGRQAWWQDWEVISDVEMNK